MDLIQVKQDVFIEVLEGFKKQDFQTCNALYQDEEGRKSPVGMLIPDDEYSPEVEHATFKSLYFRGYPFKHLPKSWNLGPKEQGEIEGFIEGLTKHHEDALTKGESPEDLKGRLTAFGTMHGVGTLDDDED